MPLEPKKGAVIGIAKGEFEVPDNIDELNDEIARMFYGDDEE